MNFVIFFQEIYLKDLMVSFFREHAKEVVNSWVKRSLEIDDATAELMEAELKGEEVDLNTLFAPGYRRSADKYQRALDLLLSEKPIDDSEVSPLDRKVIIFFRSIFYKGLVPAGFEGERIDLIEARRQIVSLLTRILLWARDESSTDERIDQIQEYLLKCFNIKEILPEYKEFVETEFGLKVGVN